MVKMHISTKVNGEAVEFLCEPQDTLLDVLRNQLGLTGTKEGCGSGDCGACSVTVDGKLVCACLVLGAEAEVADIGTVEGVASKEHLHVIQQKFLEHAALQCGICTPGLIVSTQQLLKDNPAPTEEEARYYLAGNLCRCTGYDKIIRAVMDSAETLRGGA
jgi:carbon-monoxide dehydrogenase small subunit